MSKKILSVILSITMLAAILCVGSMMASADTQQIKAGAEVNVVVTVSGIDNIGGLQFTLKYDTAKLQYVNYDLGVFDKDVYQLSNVTDGEAGFSCMFDPTGGEHSFATSNTYATINFKAVADCTTDDITYMMQEIVRNGENNETIKVYDNWEMDPAIAATDTWSNAQIIVHDPVDTDTSSDDSSSETSSITSSETSSTSSTTSSETSSTSSTTSSETSSTSSTTSSETSSIITSSNTSSSTSSITSSNTSSKNTDDNASKKTSGTTSRTTSTKGGTTGTVQTAGTIAVISLVVILMAAGAVVLFSKKKSEQE